MNNSNFFKSNVLGHPAGLFVLFFTEMWERFSYYGMKALLVLFLTRAVGLTNAGLGWDREHALALYGTYASLVYITPILGGYFADRFIGYRNAVVIGALLMTIGHGFMAFETEFFLYLALLALILGNGFFKPNMSSIISHMYEGYEEKKDGAFTIFYMGVNAGAFFGILLCGYLGESKDWGWSYGFGLAGIFMLLGMLQFYFAQPLFGDVGKPPKKIKENSTPEQIAKVSTVTHKEPVNPFRLVDKVLIALSAGLGGLWIVNDPLSKSGKIDFFPFDIGAYKGSDFIIFIATAAFLLLLIVRIFRYSSIVRNRMIAVALFALLTVFFWTAFEQAGGSMTIFANDYTDRSLFGGTALLFKIINTLITVIPLAIISWVLYLLVKTTKAQIMLSNGILTLSFIIIWGIVLWMLKIEFQKEETEMAATWFVILNPLFIIVFAPLFSKWWESKYNPSAAFKYAFGLILLGLGFALLAYGANGIPKGAQTASVSIIWLVSAYLLHTLGELCLSPLGSSYLSKLVPGRMIAFMFGVWFIAVAIGNKLAGTLGGMIDKVSEQYNMSTFFLIFTLIPIVTGVITMFMNPLFKRLMRGVR